MFTVCALYHFTRFDDPSVLRQPLLDVCRTQKITGSLLLAREGINGTIAGPRAGIGNCGDHPGNAAETFAFGVGLGRTARIIFADWFESVVKIICVKNGHGKICHCSSGG